MLKISIYLAAAIAFFSVQFLSAQSEKDSVSYQNQQEKITRLELQKKEIVEEEKEKLKAEVQNIEEKLARGEISKEAVEEQKMAAAEKAALNIQNRTAIIDNKVALIERGENDVDLNDVAEHTDDFCDNWFNFNCHNNREKVYDKRTYSSIVIAFGFNHGLIDGVSFNDTPYKIGGSKFFEIGWQWKTRLLKNSNAIRVSYGISYQSNGIKADDNMYFVKNEDVTELQEFDGNVKKAKLRMDNFVIPVFLEFGPSKKIERDEYFRYSTHHQFAVGVGGYAGLNTSTRQKLKYSRDGEDSKEKIKDNYNTNNFIYGIAGYVGVGDLSLYVKYDLNAMFKEPNPAQHNISLGLRIEL